jgi:hypothetical protein
MIQVAVADSAPGRKTRQIPLGPFPTSVPPLVCLEDTNSDLGDRWDLFLPFIPSPRGFDRNKRILPYEEISFIDSSFIHHTFSITS